LDLARSAVNHGINAKGDSSDSTALKALPSDLTRLSKSKNGIPLAANVKRTISCADDVAAHGARNITYMGPDLPSY
jgi:hypothetical protein